MSCRVKNSATQTRVLCHVSVKKFTKNYQKNSIDKLLMSKLKIWKQKFLIHYSTSRHQPQIRKGLGWKIHHSYQDFSSVFRGKTQKLISNYACMWRQVEIKEKFSHECAVVKLVVISTQCGLWMEVLIR